MPKKRGNMSFRFYLISVVLQIFLLSCLNLQTEESTESKKETDSILIESSINLEVLPFVHKIFFYDECIISVQTIDHDNVRLTSWDYDFNEEWSNEIAAKWGYDSHLIQTTDNAYLFAQIGKYHEETDSANNQIKPHIGWTTIAKVSRTGTTLWHTEFNESYYPYVAEDNEIILAGNKNILYLDFTGNVLDTVVAPYADRRIENCQALSYTSDNDLLVSYYDYSEGFDVYISKISSSGTSLWETNIGSRTIFVDSNNTNDEQLRVYGGYKMERAYLANISVENGSIEEVDLPTDIETLSLYGSCNSSNGNSNYIGIGDTITRSREEIHLFKYDKNMKLIEKQITGVGRGNWQGDMKYLGNGEFLCYTTDGYHDTAWTILFRTNMDDICYYDTLVNQWD